jgi:hypothetical protein
MYIAKFFRFHLLLLSCLFFFCTNTFAAPWRFEVAPYLWAVSMNGRTSVGPGTIHIDEDFSDILKQLNFGAMLYASAHKDAFGTYFNGVYAVLSNSDNIDNIHISGKNKFGIFGAGVSYIVFAKELANAQKISLEPYAGFRYTLNNTTIDIGRFSLTKNVNWTDPVIGLRLDYAFNKPWSVTLMGDVGGTNASTHYSYNASAILGYQPPSWSSTRLFLGYRLLDQHYQTGSGINFYDWNMKISGPMLGIGFSF